MNPGHCIILWSADWRYNIFTYYALKYSRTSVVSICGSIKTCWWSILEQVINVPALLWSRLWGKHRQFCFALTCSADASSPLVQPPSIQQSRCRWHRSIRWFKCFDNGLGHNQRHHSHTTLEPPKKTSSLTRYFAATCRLYEFSSVFRITTYWLRATITGKLRSRRVGHINGLMFAPALLMQFLERYIGVYAEVVD